MSKLHEAQEKYQETIRSRYREGVESLSTSHAEAVNITLGPSSEPVLQTHGGATGLGTAAVAAAGRNWLDAAAATNSLIVPSFAVSDYGELVRAVRPPAGLKV